MALKSIRVIEMAGLAPSPFCGLVLKDFGADVVRVDKVQGGSYSQDTLARGKRSLAINLKNRDGVETLKKVVAGSDVLLDPYRKGVMEKFELGPDKLEKINPKLIYARLSGYGHHGPLAHKAGHDINYLAMSGVLSFLGRSSSPPHFPVNLLADFAGGGLMCALGICMALYEREKSGKGQVVDASMVEGASYLSTFLWRSRNMFIWGNERGKNILDGGAAFYNTYKTKDNKYVAVGALEPLFYSNLLKGMGLNEQDCPQVHMISDEAIKQFSQVFRQKTREEWLEIFNNMDACVTPVLDYEEAPLHPHNRERNSFSYNVEEEFTEPCPAPKLSRSSTGDISKETSPEIGRNTREVLLEHDFTNERIDALVKDEAIVCND